MYRIDIATLSTILGALLVGVIVWGWQCTTRRYPPGPPRQFIVGNLKDLPSGGSEWVAYEKLGKRCESDIVYLNVLGSHLLVVNSFEAARDLLERKGGIYSSRPRLVMIKELMGWDWNLILMSYGKTFASYRKVVQQEFQPHVVATSYRPVITRSVSALLERLLTTPDDLVKHLKQMAGGIIMMITYGHQVTSVDDAYVALAEAVREHGEKTPGSNIVDVFPILKYVPAWFPGASFKREALIRRQLAMEMRTAPYNMVKGRLAEGKVVPCVVSRLLQNDAAPEDIDKDEFVKNCGGVVYSAGADTTVAALVNFFIAMTLYPAVQARAHQELDTVIGRDRLPALEDRTHLPYISNVVKEVLRWKAVSPLGVPHSTTESDEYRGMYIPKSTTVLANISAILHDEAVYKNPDEFNPDRFEPTSEKPEGEPDPARAAFGFGRRICPGRFFADESVWLAVTSVFHVFVVSKPAGTESQGVDKIRWSSGLVSLPSKFPFEIKPRFEGAVELCSVAE